ncbi:hypothetical protein MferCBS49748_004090 [Microsporum ferrugineum]
MALCSSFGIFAKLPYELRELIWLEFLPAGRDNESNTIASASARTSAAVDLRVLRASKSLYNEISYVLYSKTHLCFDLRPLQNEDASFWSTLRFKRRVRKKEFYDGGAVWRLESGYAKRDTYFDHFPFHKVAVIEIGLRGSDNASHFFWMWRNVVRTLELLGTAPSLPPIVIRLYGNKDGYNIGYNTWLPLRKRVGLRWVDSGHGWRYRDTLVPYIFDTLVLPFFSRLGSAVSIRIKVHSRQIMDTMDWTEIRFANGVLSRRLEGCNSPELQRDERKLFQEVYLAYFEMYDLLSYRYIDLWPYRLESHLRTEWYDQTLLSIIQQPAGV